MLIFGLLIVFFISLGFFCRYYVPLFLFMSLTTCLVFYSPSHLDHVLFQSDKDISFSQNWGNTFENIDVNVYIPKNLQELQSYLQHTEHKVRVAGVMHSMSPLTQSKELISLERMSGIISYDGLTVRAWAGTTIDEVQEFLKKNEKTLRGIGSITKQTLAGGLSTSLSGIEMTAFSSFLKSARTLDADGNLHTWNTDLYYLRDSMGMLGVIVDVELEVFDNCDFRTEIGTAAATNILDPNELLLVDGFDSATTFYADQNDMFTMRYYRTSRPPSARARKNQWFLREFMDIIVVPLNYWFPIWWVFDLQKNAFMPSDVQLWSIGEDEPIYGWMLISYQIPLENCSTFIEAALKDKQDGNIRVKYLKGTRDACLSVKIPACKVEFYIPQFREVKTYEELAESLGGMPHWGKYYTKNVSKLLQSFDCWSEFDALRRQHDPNSRFINSYLEGEPAIAWNGGNRLWLFYILSACLYGSIIYLCCGLTLAQTK